MQILHIVLEINVQILHNNAVEEYAMNELKTIRINKRMTQQEAAARLGVSLRSYVSYENDETKVNSSKYRFLLHEIENIKTIDEEHGLLTKAEIKEICSDVFSQYEVEYCYLFGSYAKGTAVETSDVDLLISGGVTGLKFFGLVEQLREALHKKVDLLDISQLTNNAELLNEILKDGERIYG